MKKFWYPIISILFCNPVFAQYNGFTNFEDSNGLNISIDTTALNLWQIGKPDKPGMDSAHSLPNAIVTDTLHLYPPDNTSSFTITLTPSFNIGYGSMSFYHAYETDIQHAGGYVECSTNGGKTWVNVAATNDSALGFQILLSNFYSSSDTLTTGEPAFSGTSNGWIPSFIYFGYICSKPVKRDFADTIMFRFTFKSDPFSTPHAGWGIDDISVNLPVCSGIEDISGDHAIHIFPSPAHDKINIDHAENTIISIFDVFGRKIKTIRSLTTSSSVDISHLPAGVYFTDVMDESNFRLYCGTFVKE